MVSTKATALLILLLAALITVACGETRRPIGDECIRSDDCLSGVCTSRTCVSAPTLVSGGVGSPADEIPRLPIVEAGADAPVDAPAEGG